MRGLEKLKGTAAVSEVPTPVLFQLGLQCETRNGEGRGGALFRLFLGHLPHSSLSHH